MKYFANKSNEYINNYNYVQPYVSFDENLRIKFII